MIDVTATLEYDGKTYVVERQSPIFHETFKEDEEGIFYMWTEGNYSCDCNRSEFIQEQDENFPEMQCGHEIKMKELAITYTVEDETPKE